MTTHSPHDWRAHVSQAFAGTDLYARIYSATKGSSNAGVLSDLFYDISTHIQSINAASTSKDVTVNGKKRKLEDAPLVTYPMALNLAPFFECKDVSVQVPVRKKLKIELSVNRINLGDANTSETDYGLNADLVEEAFCLPVPEKQARQSNFILFPKAGASVLGQPVEQVLFVMNETPPNTVTLHGEVTSEDDTYVTVTLRALNQWLKPSGKQVVSPSPAEFASSIPQAHRKGEKAYHVKAFRGSKEGYLFFLSNGIVFGFKKPLAFYPFSAVESISYTSVLQRTFNIVIAVLDPDNLGEAKEIEFSMIDQADFAGIDEYVKRHGLNDASMAAQRQAKAYNVNKARKAAADEDYQGVARDEDGQSELQKAEQQLQDEEDELEEDYEVSGGESEGEGESSGEEEGYDDEAVEEVEGDEEDEE